MSADLVLKIWKQLQLTMTAEIDTTVLNRTKISRLS